MKYVLVFALAVSVFAAQAQNCANPVNPSTYQNYFNQIASIQIPQNKLNKAVEFVNANCLMAAQVKNMAQLFTDEAYRLEFCKVAYAHTYDRVNYYDVYDAFNSYSSVLRLHDFVQGKAPADVPAPVIPVVVPVIAPVVTTPAPVKPIAFPKYTYPTSAGYSGNKGCDGPVLDPVSFENMAVDLSAQPTNEAKQVALQSVAAENCLDISQLMKFTSLIKAENVRLNTLVNAFPSIYDQDHYASAAALFSTMDMKNKFVLFAADHLKPPPPPCDVTEADFQSALSAVKSKNFSDDRVELVKLLAKSKCFNTEQIRAITQLAPFGDEKLAMFKALYDKCIDKGNYYTLVNELQFFKEQEDLTNFLKKK